MKELILPRRGWRYLAAAALGFALAWWIYHPRPAPVETAARAEQLPSGGQILERAPAAPVPVAVKQAAKEAGGKLERAVSITVRPRPVVISSPPSDSVATAPNATKPEPGQEVSTAPACSCAPVTVDLGLVRMPDDTRRVVATSQDGEIVGGLDIPTLLGLKVARQLRWAAGGTVGYTTDRKREFGAFIDRDLGPLRLGLEIQQRNGNAAAVVRVGIRF